MTTIAIFGPAADQEVDALQKRVRHRGAEPWVIDLARYPADSTISFKSDKIIIDGRPLDGVDAAFLRRVGTGLPSALTFSDIRRPVQPAQRWTESYPEALARLKAEPAAMSVRLSVLHHLAARRIVINPAHKQHLHRTKGHLLQRLADAGLPVPSFVLGSNLLKLNRFSESMARDSHETVAKPPAALFKTRLWNPEAAMAERPRPRLLQRRIIGDTVRCYVLGGKLLSAARIVHGGQVDSSVSQTGIQVTRLRPRAREVAETVARVLGLRFCGLDLMLDRRDGERPHVIDCNLSPMFVNYGRLSRCDVAGHLADLLLNCAEGDRPQQRAPVLGLVDEAKAILADDPDIAGLIQRADTRRRR